jgi:pyruvate, water dikinase
VVGFFRRFMNKFTLTTERPPTSSEESRSLFKTKYIAFKQLLDANNNALRIISQMEQALSGTDTFGMTFIRSHCTAACVNVYTMISHLQELSGGRYPELEEVFERVEARINSALAYEHVGRGSSLVLPLSDLDRNLTDEAGGKMALLGEIKTAFPWLHVPDGFVITSAAFEYFMRENDLQSEINRIFQSSEASLTSEMIAISSEVQLLILNAVVPEPLATAIKEAYFRLEANLTEGVRVSMRSSAVGEDTAHASFAGQYRSELNVSPDNLLTAYKEIVASKYSLTAIAYRQRKGIPDHLVPMCVGCMPMVQATSGGVVYSRNPVEFEADQTVINAVPGLPKAVVDGSGDPDRFLVSMVPEPKIVERSIRHKTCMLVTLPGEGIQAMDVPIEKADHPSISDARALELASIARTLEEYFETPVDIEWLVDPQDRTVILQCRPLASAEIAAHRTTTFLATAKNNQVVIRGGETASPGVASGQAHVVRTNEDLLFFPDGALLIASQARPRWAALLPRAVGVITEHGSITGHLANVAREFRIPALFNVPGALTVLDSTEQFTLDADTGVIYKGILQELLDERDPPKPLMEGTYVHSLLKEVMAGISPLHLTDPDSMHFKPEHCRTLHDITRFCHEMAVQDMFELGKNPSLVQKASKRLLVDVPMQWWVLDLENGFTEPVPGELVHISKIQSIPMLALWEGIVSHPWQGPPPIDGKGFMAVMVEATANPDLSSSGPSIYANKNYFMISKNFCNLTSRMGFHFSTVETLVGDQAYENSIRFSFKGGAADYKRRCLRTAFLDQLLARYDFQMEHFDDALFARIRGGSEKYILERLKILGYIIIHARQLDMIMSNKEKAGYYFEKMCNDIATLTGEQSDASAACPFPLPDQL